MFCLSVLGQQNTRTAYFMDSYIYRYRFNPALELRHGHAGFLIGSISAAPESNVGLSTFVYPAGEGELTSFLSPDVDSRSFLSSLSKNNRAHAGVDLSLLSFAFKTDNYTHFIDFGVRSNSYVNAPYDLFRLLKEGNTNGTSFNLDRFSLRTDNYAELSYGLSTDITDRLRLGGRVKFLAGVAQSRTDFTRAQLNVSGDKWSVDALGHTTISLPRGFTIPLKENGALDLSNIETPEGYRNSFPAGFGAAADLGVVFDIAYGLQASFAVLDLGFIRWNNAIKASTSSDVWEFEGFDDLDVTTEGDEDISDRLEQAKNDLIDCFSFYPENSSKLNSMLEMTLNGGLEYTFNSYDKLSVGLLGSARINGKCSWAEGRLSLNWNATNWFSLSASGAWSHFGPSGGVAMNLRAGPIDFFAGVDSLVPFTKLNPQFIPVGRMNTNATIGLNILIRE